MRIVVCVMIQTASLTPHLPLLIVTPNLQLRALLVSAAPWAWSTRHLLTHVMAGCPALCASTACAYCRCCVREGVDDWHTCAPGMPKVHACGDSTARLHLKTPEDRCTCAYAGCSGVEPPPPPAGVLVPSGSCDGARNGERCRAGCSAGYSGSAAAICSSGKWEGWVSTCSITSERRADYSMHSPVFSKVRHVGVVLPQPPTE